jgi:DNA-binding transcriptional MerR regulator
MPPPGQPENTALLRIGAVAQRTGISTHTIRIWERRYGVLAPKRASGGGRLYSDADVARLLRLKSLVAAGHSIGEVARLGDDALAALSPGGGRWLGGEGAGSPKVSAQRAREARTPRRFVGVDTESVRRALLSAVARLDAEDASAILAASLVEHPPEEVIEQIIAPALAEIGERWSRAELTAAHEHAASAVVRAFLGSLLRAQRPKPDAPVAVATTLTGERHELGAMMAAVLLAIEGWRVVYLGADLPVADIASAAGEVGASLILVSVVYPDRGVAAALEELATRTRARVVVGGRLAAGLAVERVEVIADVRALAQPR